MEDASWAFSKTFTAQFQKEQFDLDSRLEAAKSSSNISPEAIQYIALAIAKLSKSLADATGSLPSYDQKQYENQVKSLESKIESLRRLGASKPKFSFKRKAPSTLSTPPVPSPSTKTEDPPAQRPTTKEPTSFVLSSHSHKYLSRSSLPDHTDQSDLSISDLDNCVIDLLHHSPNADANPSQTENLLRISALHARNLTRCILLLPSMNGSALLHDLNDCIIVLGCHQFRMHTSKKTDVFLSITSNPIIEDCHGIRFSKYPEALGTSEPKQESSINVQDFSHIRPSASPNFSTMSEETHAIIIKAILAAREPSPNLDELLKILQN